MPLVLVGVGGVPMYALVSHDDVRILPFTIDEDFPPYHIAPFQPSNLGPKLYPMSATRRFRLVHGEGELV